MEPEPAAAAAAVAPSPAKPAKKAGSLIPDVHPDSKLVQPPPLEEEDDSDDEEDEYDEPGSMTRTRSVRESFQDLPDATDLDFEPGNQD
eukprot:SAG22_NODE_406_length_10984_cov_28.344970_10_plen_89_part_00